MTCEQAQEIIFREMDQNILDVTTRAERVACKKHCDYCSECQERIREEFKDVPPPTPDQQTLIMALWAIESSDPEV